MTAILICAVFLAMVASFYSQAEDDAIKRQIAEGKTPSITYKKVNGENVILSVYKLNGDKENSKETL